MKVPSHPVSPTHGSLLARIRLRAPCGCLDLSLQASQQLTEPKRAHFEQLPGYPTNGPQITTLLWPHGRMRWRGEVKMSHFLLCRGMMCSCCSCQHPWPRYLNPTMVLHFCPTDAMIPLQIWGCIRCQACQHPRKEENSVHPCKHQSP